MTTITKVMQVGTSDCERACVATYFGVRLDEVPDLAGKDWEDVLREWLHRRGMNFFTATVESEAVFRRVFSRGMVIAGGISSRGNHHAVIYLDGELWHDPWPDGSGIERIDDVDVFFPLVPAGAEVRP